ncbi:MAG: hypothetical protein COB67_07615, partial [SAR324 cluster bacterium]
MKSSIGLFLIVVLVILFGSLFLGNFEERLYAFSFSNILESSTKMEGQEVLIEENSVLFSGLLDYWKTLSRSKEIRRREKPSNFEFSLPDEVVLNDSFPHLVWENLGVQYRYELQIGENHYWVPSTQEKMVRIRLWPFQGRKEVRITLYEGTRKIKCITLDGNREQQDYHVRWQGADEQAKLMNQLDFLRRENSDQPL